MKEYKMCNALKQCVTFVLRHSFSAFFAELKPRDMRIKSLFQQNDVCMVCECDCITASMHIQKCWTLHLYNFIKSSVFMFILPSTCIFLELPNKTKSPIH